MMCSFAALEGQKLEAVKEFEKKSGKVVLAFSCMDVNADSLSDSELSAIKELEGKLGLSLVAVK